MEASLYSLSVPIGFGGRTGSDVNSSYIFLQDVLAPITLVGDGAGNGGARVRAKYDWGLLLCSVANNILLGSRFSF